MWYRKGEGLHGCGIGRGGTARVWYRKGEGLHGCGYRKGEGLHGCGYRKGRGAAWMWREGPSVRGTRYVGPLRWYSLRFV